MMIWSLMAHRFPAHALFLVILALALAACAAPVVPLEEEEPFDFEGPADIYGRDDRSEPYDSDDVFQVVARSTALVATTGSFRFGANGNYYLSAQTLSDKLARELGGPLCESERFRDQPAPGYCSAFLIAPDLVATAGHCINIRQTCADIRFVFGFAHDGPGSEDEVTLVEDDDFYRCASVVGHLFDQDSATYEDLLDRNVLWSDWAVVLLDRPVVGRQPLSLRRLREPIEGEQVAAVGYPGGVPLKITTGQIVDAVPELYFNTDLDIYQGNSGSVVVNEWGMAEGIVIRGSGGNSYERRGSCFVSQQCDAYDPTPRSGCRGNHVMRIDPILRFVDSEEILRHGTSAPSNANTIPDGAGAFLGELVFDEPGTIRFVTLNLGMRHLSPADLRISLERVETGASAVIFDHPTLQPAGYPTFSRTTGEFDGQVAAGRWRVRVEDLRENGNEGSMGFFQLVIGVGQSYEPRPSGATFIGSPCSTDEDCTFDGSARCHVEAGASDGLCTIGCDGTCPDRAGFATTFCVSLDDGASGNCLPKAHTLNDNCAALPGTTALEAERFIGTSDATPSTARVCHP